MIGGEPPRRGGQIAGCRSFSPAQERERSAILDCGFPWSRRLTDPPGDKAKH